MSRETFIDLSLLFSATTFRRALKGLGSPKRARYGTWSRPWELVAVVPRSLSTSTDTHCTTWDSSSRHADGLLNRLPVRVSSR